MPNGGAPPESEFAKSYAGLENKMIRWTDREPNRDGFLVVDPPPANATLFAFARVESATDREAELFVGNDDSIIIWLNGVKVFEQLTGPGELAYRHHVKVRLKKGSNPILVRCNNDSGPWGFSVRVSQASNK